MRDENCRVVLFFCEQQATQGNSRHRESKKSWFFVYSSPFFIVLFFWHALASLFLLSFPEFRKMLKMSSFFFGLPRTQKKFHPKQLLKVFFHFGDCEMIMNGEKLNDELIALKFVKLKPDMKKMRPRKKHEMLGCDFCHTF